jgi:hypothetical protein
MAPQWFELPGSFAVDAWFRPSRLFLGSTVEGAIISCLITDRPVPVASPYFPPTPLYQQHIAPVKPLVPRPILPLPYELLRPPSEQPRGTSTRSRDRWHSARAGAGRWRRPDQ